MHALNILRALFRDSRLAEHVVAFIPEAVEVAIGGFSASLWPVSAGTAVEFLGPANFLSAVLWRSMAADMLL